MMIYIFIQEKKKKKTLFLILNQGFPLCQRLLHDIVRINKLGETRLVKSSSKFLVLSYKCPDHIEIDDLELGSFDSYIVRLVSNLQATKLFLNFFFQSRSILYKMLKHLLLLFLRFWEWFHRLHVQ